MTMFRSYKKKKQKKKQIARVVNLFETVYKKAYRDMLKLL